MPNLPSLPSGLIKQDWNEALVAATANTADVNPHTKHHNDIATLLNATYGPSILAYYNFATDPGLGYHTLSQPTGLEHFTASQISNRHRYTGDASVTSPNHRIVAPSPKLGTMGDSEVFSEWHAIDESLATAAGNRQMGHCHRATAVQQIRKNGLATSATDSTLVDSTAPFLANEFIGLIGGEKNYFVTITAGIGPSQTRRIVGNTTTTLTVDSDWDINPDNTSYYRVWSENVRAHVFAWDILFNRAIFHFYTWEGNVWNSLGNVDLSAYLKPGGTMVELPWYVATRVVGRSAQLRVWKGTDDESDYTTSGRSASWTVPEGWDQSGESGLYVGHLDVGQWMEFKNLIVRRI